MIFSPYLIHGGGSNDSTNITRISLELRFGDHKKYLICSNGAPARI